MITHTIPSNLLPVGTWLSIITIRIDGQTASRKKFPPDFYIFWFKKLDKIFHNYIDHIFMKISVVSE